MGNDDRRNGDYCAVYIDTIMCPKVLIVQFIFLKVIQEHLYIDQHGPAYSSVEKLGFLRVKSTVFPPFYILYQQIIPACSKTRTPPLPTNRKPTVPRLVQHQSQRTSIAAWFHCFAEFRHPLAEQRQQQRAQRKVSRTNFLIWCTQLDARKRA